MKNNTPQEIWDKLKTCKKVAMTLHAGPDGDSLGSCTALKHILERDLKCKVTLVSYDELPDNLSDFDFVKDVKFGTDITELNAQDFDATIFLDCGSEQLISGKLKLDYELPKNGFTINIDHHPTNSGFGNLNYIAPEEMSTCSALLNIFRELKIKFDKKLSTALLLGIYTDSGLFKNKTNYEKLFSDALFLIQNGAEYREKITKIVGQESFDFKKFKGLILTNLKFDEKRKTAYSVVPLEELKKVNANLSGIRSSIYELQSIREADILFTLVETEDSIKGSIRSKTEFDVSLVAKELGGGGHKLASGFRLKDLSLKEAEQKVLDAIDKVSKNKK